MDASSAATVPVMHACAANHGPGLPRVVLEVRMRLGPEATPEDVAEEVRAAGIPGVTDEEVRQLWDEGHLPVG